VDGVSRIDGEGGSMGSGMFSGAWGECRVRMGDCGGGRCTVGELCTLLIVWTVRL
jgi:hypothetical protein